jgi:hypothetical protein
MANFRAPNAQAAKSVAVLSDVKSDYSVGLAKFFKEGFTVAGGKSSRNKITAAATRILTRNSPPSRRRIPTEFLCPAITPKSD